MSILIRNYQDDDSSKLEQLLKDAGLYYESIDKKEIFKKKIEYDTESIIVAEDNDKLIGTVFIIYDPWNPCIYHLGVHPDYRNKGIANKLMGESEGRLKAKGVERITLFVGEENHKALDFYKKRGWKLCGKTICMEKELNKKRQDYENYCYQDNDASKLEQLLKDVGLYYEPLDKKEIFKKKIEHDPESIIIAKDNRNLVGAVFIIYDPWNSSVYHLGVHPNYRNKGIASKLMEEAEGRLKAKGIERVALFVEEENSNAIDFYKKRGWKICNKNFAMEKEL